MNKEDVKRIIYSNGLRLWQVAYELGIDDSRFSRVLRKQLSKDMENSILQAITKLTGNSN